MQFVVDAVDRVGRGAVEADAGDPGLDECGSGSGVRIAPAAPVGVGAPVGRVARAEQDDVVRAHLGEETAEHIKTDRAGLVRGQVDCQRLGHQAVQRDVVERGSASDLVGGRVNVGAGVVDERVLRHRVAVGGHLGEVAEGRRGDALHHRHAVGHALGEVDDPHRAVSKVPTVFAVPAVFAAGLPPG